MAVRTARGKAATAEGDRIVMATTGDPEAFMPYRETASAIIAEGLDPA